MYRLGQKREEYRAYDAGRSHEEAKYAGVPKLANSTRVPRLHLGAAFSNSPILALAFVRDGFGIRSG